MPPPFPPNFFVIGALPPHQGRLVPCFGHDFIPEALDYLARYPLTDDQLASVEKMVSNTGGVKLKIERLLLPSVPKEVAFRLADPKFSV